MATVGEKAKGIVYDEVGNAEIIAEAAGNNRYIAVTNDMVFVGSKGLGATGSFGGKKVKRYPVDEISTVDVKKGMAIVTFEIGVAGAIETSRVNSGFMDAANNENVTAFAKKDYSKAQEIAKIIMDLKQQMKKQAVAPVANEASIPEQIKQLSELKDSGILTEAEFEQKKAELLQRM